MAESETYRQSDVQVPHFKVPFQFGGKNGGAQVTEQDSNDEIFDGVKVLFAFPVGSRNDLPEFGMPDLAFREFGRNVDHIVSGAIEAWHPRAAEMVNETEIRDEVDELVRHIIVTVGTPSEDA